MSSIAQRNKILAHALSARFRRFGPFPFETAIITVVATCRFRPLYNVQYTIT